jgi:hypothetical protein
MISIICIPHGVLLLFDEHRVRVALSHQSSGKVVSSRIPLRASTHISLEIIKLLLKNLQCCYVLKISISMIPRAYGSSISP